MITFKDVAGNYSNVADASAPNTYQAQEDHTIPTPSKAGYTFEGWYIDAELTMKYDFNTPMPANSITLYAKYTKVSVAPSTGDTTNTMTWLGLMLAAMGIALASRRKIKG